MRISDWSSDVCSSDLRGRYSRIGGIEVARKGDDERMRELERRVSSGRAFGNRVEMITPQKVKELMPLVDESVIQGALWDPDAGLVIPRSQVVAGEMIRDAEATGKLRSEAHTSELHSLMRNSEAVF